MNEDLKRLSSSPFLTCCLIHYQKQMDVARGINHPSTTQLSLLKYYEHQTQQATLNYGMATFYHHIIQDGKEQMSEIMAQIGDTDKLPELLKRAQELEADMEMAASELEVLNG